LFFPVDCKAEEEAETVEEKNDRQVVQTEHSRVMCPGIFLIFFGLW
jgi:hypothetical protein